MPQRDTQSSETRAGFLYGTGAYLLWGVLPLYWKALDAVSSTVILGHRIVFAAVFFTLWLFWARRGAKNPGIVRNLMKQGWKLLLSALLVGGNWLVYISAVNSGHIVETSLGYFINPLLTVLIGAVFLKERLRPAQVAAVFLAACGVLILTWNQGRLPGIALFLGLTFAGYGWIRKKTTLDPLLTSTVEAWILVPAAAFYLFQQDWMNGAAAARPFLQEILLVGSGIVTGLPLVWFVFSTARLPLSVVGFLQYIAPTLQFLIGVWIYKEPFSAGKLFGYIWVWAGLAVFIADLTRDFLKRLAEGSRTVSGLPGRTASPSN